MPIVGLFGLAVLGLVGALCAPARAEILIVAPHPDDDIITSAGVVLRARESGESVHVVYMTNGDATGLKTGNHRQDEAVAAMAHLKVPEDHLLFLGYPDGGLSSLRGSHLNPPSAYEGPSGLTTTYGHRGLGGSDYHRYAFGKSADNNGINVKKDLSNILTTFKPAHIFVTSEFDMHADHAATYQFVIEALKSVVAWNVSYNPTIHKTIVWNDFNNQRAWPNTPSPLTYFDPIPSLETRTSLRWQARESLDVPVSMLSTTYAQNPKYRAIAEHGSQGGNAPGSYIDQFFHRDEIFWTEQVQGLNRPPIPEAGMSLEAKAGETVTLDGSKSSEPDGTVLFYRWKQVAGPSVTLKDATSARASFVVPRELKEPALLGFELVVSDGSLTSIADGVSIRLNGNAAPMLASGSNVARTAKSRASKQAPNQGADKAIDGVAQGHPIDASREWAADRQTTGAYLQLDWDKPQHVEQVVLYDRPNPDDHVLAGKLTFSDGSKLAVGALDNAGGPVRIEVKPRDVRWLRFTITKVGPKTSNAGLAEIEVFDAKASEPSALTASAPAPTGAPVGSASALLGSAVASPVPQSPPDAVVARGPIMQQLAKVTASSETPNQEALKAVDGHPQGHPVAPTREWASRSERSGAYLQLDWSAPQAIREVVLYDRPNPDDHVVAGKLTFSDGSTVPVKELDNAGGPTSVTFPPRTVTWVRFTVTKVGKETYNAGLAEIDVR